MNDEELESAMRDGLSHRAADVDVTAPVAARAAASVRRRGRTRTVSGVAAAIALVVGVGVGIAATRDGGQEPATGVATDPAAPEVTEQGWRTEYWRDVSVDVPAEWGWGSAPMGSEGRLFVCGGSAGGGYVGRPVLASDACFTYDVAARPLRAPYVWLGSQLPEQTTEYANGVVQQTIDAGGTTVTVASDDADLREHVLDSVSGEPGPCAPTLDSAPAAADGAPAGIDDPQSLLVCAYRLGADGVVSLVYATERSRGDADRLARAIRAPRRLPALPRCKESEEWVALSLDGPGQAPIVADLTCDTLDAGAGAVRLSPRLVAPWVDGGLRATMPYFVGGLG